MGSGVTSSLDLPFAGPAGSGLLVAATVIRGDGRWLGGVEIESLGCNPGQLDDPCDEQTFTPGASTLITGDPMDVRFGYKCSPGRSTDFEAKARAALAAFESKRIAQGFEHGVTGLTMQTLDSPTDALGTAADSLDAFERLEGYLATCGNGNGMIHATRELATRWAADNVITRDAAGRLVSYLGTLIVADAGYDGADQAGTPTGTLRFAYATAPVTVWIGDVQMLDAIDRSDNTRIVIASEAAFVAFESCCSASIAVDGFTDLLAP